MSHHRRRHSRPQCASYWRREGKLGDSHTTRRAIAKPCDQQREGIRRRKGPKPEEYIDMLREECPNPDHGGYPWGPYLQTPRSGRSDLVWCWRCDLIMPRILKAREG